MSLLSILLGVTAAIAATGGIGSGIYGAAKISEAKETMESIKTRHEKNIRRLENTTKKTVKIMDELGKLELEILRSFDDFSNTIEQIQNKPIFKEYKKDGVVLTKYDGINLKEVSTGASVILTGLGGGAALGTAGGFAASGATASAVMAFGTASTGTAISSLSGAAATNATLATIGGGSLAAGGGGMALGSILLNVTTLGVGLLVGGIIFNIVGSKVSDQVDEAREQVEENEKKINKICKYLRDLKSTAENYTVSLTKARDRYEENFEYVLHAVNDLKKTDWNDFTEEEKIATQNTVLLVELLYKMCQVNLVNKTSKEDDINTVNHTAVDKSVNDANSILSYI